jgi:hypothetical protein
VLSASGGCSEYLPPADPKAGELKPVLERTHRASGRIDARTRRRSSDLLLSLVGLAVSPEGLAV